VPLREPIRVGAIEITAKRIERRLVAIAAEQPKKDSPQASQAKEALVLHLFIENKSDESIKPLDFYFDRRWTTSDGSTRRPYTLVEMYKRFFYGGPLDRPKEPKHQDATARRTYAFLFKSDGEPAALQPKQDHDRILKPHTSMSTWLCTDCNDPTVIQTLERQTLTSGKYLWRVQVRRGKEQSAAGQEVWATAVIGFEFSPTDVNEVK